MRISLYFVSYIAIIAACSSNESQHITEEDCQKVREHTADLRLTDLRSKLSSDNADIEIEKHRKNFANAGGQAHLTTCIKSHDLNWVNCSLDAATLKEMHTCN